MELDQSGCMSTSVTVMLPMGTNTRPTCEYNCFMYKQLRVKTNGEVGIPASYPQGTYLRPEPDVLLEAFRGNVTAASRHVPPYRTR